MGKIPCIQFFCRNCMTELSSMCLQKRRASMFAEKSSFKCIYLPQFLLNSLEKNYNNQNIHQLSKYSYSVRWLLHENGATRDGKNSCGKLSFVEPTPNCPTLLECQTCKQIQIMWDPEMFINNIQFQFPLKSQQIQILWRSRNVHQ